MKLRASQNENKRMAVIIVVMKAFLKNQDFCLKASELNAK